MPVAAWRPVGGTLGRRPDFGSGVEIDTKQSKLGMWLTDYAIYQIEGNGNELCHFN